MSTELGIVGLEGDLPHLGSVFLRFKRCWLWFGSPAQCEALACSLFSECWSQATPRGFTWPWVAGTVGRGLLGGARLP